MFERFYPGSTTQLISLTAQEFGITEHDVQMIHHQLTDFFTRVHGYSAKRSIFEVSESLYNLMFPKAPVKVVQQQQATSVEDCD